MSNDLPTSGRNTKTVLDSIKNVNNHGMDFWSARDLMPLLGYDSWRRFDEVVEKAMVSCKTAGEITKNHFVGADKMVRIGSQTERRVKDYHLSRYACYLIAQNGDPRKPEISLAQTYFAIQTRRQELVDERADMEARLAMRNRVIDHNKALSSAAKDAGVQNRMFGVFHDAGYKGLYDGLGAQDLKQIRGLKKSQQLLDHMGRAELAANDFRITQTEERLRNQNIRGQQGAIDTHYDVGKKVRQTMREIGGTMPEEMPVEPSIKPLIDKQRRELRRLKGGNGKRGSE